MKKIVLCIIIVFVIYLLSDALLGISLIELHKSLQEAADAGYINNQ